MAIHWNKVNITLLISLCLMSFCNIVKAQQEPIYSQYMFNMININPAYAGNKAVDNVTLLFRNQWLNLEGSPETGSLTFDKRVINSNVGFGAQLNYDKIGIEKTTGLQLFYAYHIPLTDASLSMGVSGGVINYRVAYGEAHPLDPSDPMFAQNANAWLPSAGFGVLYSTYRWYVGFSIPAMLSTKVTIDNVISQSGFGADNHYFVTGGYIFNAGNLIKLKPSILFKAVHGAPVQFDLNMNAWYDNTIGLGVSYRTGDAIVSTFEIKVSPQMRLGYAYDYTLTNLGNFSKGTHEVMIRYEFYNSGNKRIFSPRYY